ncbi:MAG: hypothetical protein GX649_08395, partial [Chloroflexi bacterium]|nr:hypothetical protein [Chloroflexota bacterium]
MTLQTRTGGLRVAVAMVVVLVAGALLGQGASGAQAQAGRGHLKRVQALGAEDTGVAHPVGLAY